MKKIFLIPIFAFIVVLSGCNTDVDLSNNSSSDNASAQTSQFKGTKGDFMALNDNKVELEASSVSDGQAHYFHTILPSGEAVYFFIVKSPDGKLRAAANGCQVCGDALQGFRQEGNFMTCNTCGNKYPLNKIATEKGGCNPAPISPDLKVENGKVTISVSELEEIIEYF